MRVTMLLGCGLVVIATAVGLVLSRPPLVRAGESSTSLIPFADVHREAELCRPGERLPEGTSALRLGLESALGPHVTVRVLAGSRLLTTGELAAGWTGKVITVPVKRVRSPAANAKICVRLRLYNEYVAFLGAPTAPAVGDTLNTHKRLPGTVRVEYLRLGRRSWWSLLSTVTRNIGFDRAQNGAALLGALLALMLAAVALTVWFARRELA